MRISDWSSDVCSSDLFHPVIAARTGDEAALVVEGAVPPGLIVRWLPPPTDKSKKKRPKGDDVDDAIATTAAQLMRMLEHRKVRDPSSEHVGSGGMHPGGAPAHDGWGRCKKKEAGGLHRGRGCPGRGGRGAAWPDRALAAAADGQFE